MNKHIPPQLWSFDDPPIPTDEMIIDSFAGGGGASTGIELALGRSPDVAINHDAEALALHRANHPETLHLNSNIYHVDPLDVTKRRKVGLMWASPDCKDFSKAKGGTPVRRHIRGLAWTVVLWIERARPRVIILENVEEFQQWGPVIEGPKGAMPDPARRGETFAEWVAAIKKHGYKIEWRELRACDYGAPTTRKRLFVIARCDRRPIVWPETTHGAPDDPDVIAGKKLPWVTAAEIIDWSEPCPSIFDTSVEIMAKFGVRAVRPLADNTMARIGKGVWRYVIRAAKPFTIRTDHSSAKTAGVHNIDEPIRTVTGAGGLALIAPHFSAAQHGGSMRSADEPLHTVTASPKDQNQVVAAHLMTMRNAGKPFNEADKPTHTITAGGAGLSLVAASMVQTGYGEREGREPRALDPGAPLGTVVAGGGKHAAVAAFLAQHNAGPRPGAPGHDAREPVSAVTASGSQQAVVSAGLMNLKGSDRRMSDVEDPAPTVTATGNHVAEVRAFLMKYYGVDQDPRLEEPLSTVTTKDRFGIVMVDGEPYQITDIGMRMLTPRELFKAQGFPEGYEIATGVFEDGTRKPLTKTAQVRMVGNSVCPPIAAALVGANVPELAIMREAAE